MNKFMDRIVESSKKNYEGDFQTFICIPMIIMIECKISVATSLSLGLSGHLRKNNMDMNLCYSVRDIDDMTEIFGNREYGT